MDLKDLHILSIISQNSKVTNAQLAERISLSPASTLERVRRLEDRKIIIGYNAKISYSKIGYNHSFVICIRISKETSEDKDRLLSILENNSNVKSIVRTQGTYQYLINIHTRTSEEIYNLIQDISALHNIEKVETLISEEEMINTKFTNKINEI